MYLFLLNFEKQVTAFVYIMIYFTHEALDEVLNDICYWICHTDGVRDDVELFLVEVLEVSPDVVKQASLGDGSLEGIIYEEYIIQ